MEKRPSLFFLCALSDLSRTNECSFAHESADVIVRALATQMFGTFLASRLRHDADIGPRRFETREDLLGLIVTD